MADKTTDGLDAVSLPGGSFDREALDKALTDAGKKPAGAERDAAIAQAIEDTNQTKTAEFLAPGMKRVRRGDVLKDDPFPDETMTVFDADLLAKQVKNGDAVEVPATPPAEPADKTIVPAAQAPAASGE